MTLLTKDELATHCKMSPSWVQAHLKEWEAAGLVVRVGRCVRIHLEKWLAYGTAKAQNEPRPKKLRQLDAILTGTAKGLG